MKIKRFVAKDIRLAMRMVKDELGADAVIMSNRSVEEGVEIVAARDFDEEAVRQDLNTQSSMADETPKQKKRIELTDFDAENNNLHIVSSPRKIGADGVVPKRPAIQRNIDQYMGYAEKDSLLAERKKVLEKNIGTQLLTSIEQAAINRGCKKSLLDTLNFQAMPFYQARGYQTQWIQEGYPKTGCKYYMVKHI